MPKAYDHHEAEEQLYEWWESRGYFKPETQARLGQTRADAEPFVISMPPPNVTGALHVGHALTNSVEDMLIRYNRMLGKPTLWVPGTDHAGIATQNVVERKLDEQGTSRHALGRAAFVSTVWDWKDEYHTRISAQQKRMGISCDWSRERFTLDDGLSEAVLEAFIRLYNDGLIYRGNYLVNWCPRCGSAISDLEVEYEEVEGKLYTFRYPLAEGGYIEVSTTRPETILGDSAVAVHPDDPRYTALIGKTALVPMLNREIPVIADPYVDPEFGTGALKVTPGHDPNDYEIGKRHHLPMINIMNNDATLNEEAGDYAGFDRFEARRKLWADMQDAGLVVGEKAHAHQVGHCQRCNTVVEPLLREQWWMRTKELAAPAIEAVRTGAIEIIPKRFERTYFHWMENIRDWCISRQLWWGHRIPIWYGPDGHAFAARSESDAQEQAIAHYGESVHLEQDPDVLDTWFSSGLWPYSTLGWPEATEDLETFYPTTVLETGYDILFFWVARMVMLGMRFTGEVPFRKVYLHGLVRVEDGRKMSKSLGNALDPLDLIRDYGADAMRFSLLTAGTPGNDLKLSPARIEANRNFANKIWNAARFVILNLEDADLDVTRGPDPFDDSYQLPPLAELTLADRWILARLQAVSAEATRLIDNWQIGEAGRQLYEFVWNEFCDWYIEAAKVSLYEGTPAAAQSTRHVLAYVLENSLRLLHPFMPFVTEAIWQNLPQLPSADRALIISRWPQPTGQEDSQAVEDFTRIQEIVHGVRNVRAEYGVEPAKRIPVAIAGAEFSATLTAQLPLLASLARLDAQSTTIETDLAAPEKSVTVTTAGISVYLPLAGLVDLAAERARLQKELDNLNNMLARSRGLLDNEGFVNKAPANVIERERAKIEELVEKEQQLRVRIQEI
ncbi:MAG: valine--tRNA ligase [Litorilinea sp.]